MDVAAALNEAKFERELSEYQMAELLGASQVSVNRWLSGNYLPTRPYWKAIAVFLGVPEDEVAAAIKQEKRLRSSGPSNTEARLERIEGDIAEIREMIGRLLEQRA